MQKLFKEIAILLIVSVTSAMGVNYLSAVGIPLFGQWDQRQGVVSADPQNKIFASGREIDDIEVAKQLFDQNAVVFIDARSSSDFEEGHIQGAFSLPLGEFDALIETIFQQIPPEQPIITYCSGRTCEDSHLVAQMLTDMGYEEVSVMIDGLPGWQMKGYPIE
jgi:rhodanese-related sulfurtransferase